MSLPMIALGVAALYGLARGIMDLRQGRYWWGATALLCGALCGAALLRTPIPSHAVKLELPPTAGN